MQQYRSKCFLFVLALMLLADGVAAWSSSNHAKAFRSSPPHNGKPIGNRHEKPCRKQNLTKQKMLKNAAVARVRDTAANGRKSSTTRLSQSVLASCDTLPSFPTAHGLLSPETVSRIEDLAESGHGSDALVNFVKQYRQKGPLSCLSMLSDPDVLPHLTQAMRDVAE